MTSIKSYNKRYENMKTERSTYMPLWRELSDYHLANRGRFLVSDRNKANKRNTRQVNNTSHLSARTLASGMMAGITSPSRPWFRLGTTDDRLSESAAVKQWLHDVQTVMYSVFAASNTYTSLHALYGELGVFGTSAMGVFEDFENVIRCKTYTVGSYAIALNGEDLVDTFYREYQLTVAQCVKEFGLKNCSQSVQEQWSKGNTENWITVMFLIEPNDDRDNNSPLARDLPFRAAYYEVNNESRPNQVNSSNNDQFLKQSGFNEFSVLTPRWDVVGEDVYASDCPGMTTLGDTKSLQLGAKRLYQAVDKVVSPPLQGPSELRNKINGHHLKPNEIVYTTGDNKLDTIYKFQPDLNAIESVNNEAENRIQRGFYEDLFLMLANSDRRQITAREVAEKHEEKLLMLGPVLERLHTELLGPLIDRTFNILQRGGVLPPPPEELQNVELNVEYVSVLAQAQRLVSLGSLERLSGYVASLSEIWPEARNKFDAAQSIDDYSEALGTNPKVVRSDDDAEALTEADRQAAAQAQAAEQAQVMADVAKTASDTDINDENALGRTLSNAGLT